MGASRIGKAVVCQPFQVSYRGDVFGPGETVSAPENVIRHWVENGWVAELAFSTKSTKPAREVLHK